MADYFYKEARYNIGTGQYELIVGKIERPDIESEWEAWSFRPDNFQKMFWRVQEICIALSEGGYGAAILNMNGGVDTLYVYPDGMQNMQMLIEGVEKYLRNDHSRD